MGGHRAGGYKRAWVCRGCDNRAWCEEIGYITIHAGRSSRGCIFSTKPRRAKGK